MKSQNIPLKAVCVLALFFLLLASCSLPSAVQSTPTSVFPTATLAPTQAPTQAPTFAPTPLPPTSTPIPPTATPKAAAVRIVFARGATAGIAQGTLQPGTTQDFVLEAGQSQPMIVNLDSPSQDIFFGIVGVETGSTLLDPVNKWNSWEGILQVTQDYVISVHGGASSENFTLTVNIPSRITFGQGGTTATVNGSTPGGLVVSYVLYALANQKMTVALNVPANSAALTIYGFEDGQPLVRSQFNTTSWSDQLPATEDYIIQVVPNAGQVVNYTMTVTVK